MAFDQKKADRVTRFIECLKHTKGEFHGKPFALLPWQRKIINDVFGTMRDESPDQRQYSTAYIEVPKKCGKLLALDTPIPTPDGWSTMGSLQVGDYVFGENGKPCRVVAKSDVDDSEQAYRLTFRDGSSIIAGEHHLWDIEYIYGKRKQQLLQTGEIYNLMEVHRQHYTAESCPSVIRIPVTQPLKCPEAILPIAPYLYGRWLDNNRDKCIQPNYLRASEEQRWALLQGLMDSDGCISTERSQSIYCSTIKGLAESVRELLWSLGIKNTIHESPSTRLSIPTGETLYTISFTSFDDQPTSRLQRKAARKRERVKPTRSCFHYLKSIEPLSYPVKMQCIQVDSASHLYLAGPSMVPTHNSELGAAIALNMLTNDDEWKAEVYSCASDRQQAAIVFDVAVDMVHQSPALSKRIKIIPSMKRMVYQPTGSIYQVLSSEVATKHGLNVSACIFDELHTQPTRALYDVMTQGSGDARKQPLWIFLTTAGTDRNSICWEVHQKALDILEGRKRDPRFYPVIYGLPDDADWQDEKNWYRANPSLDHTISIDKVRDAYHKALETPADENMFRQLRLNQWVKQSVRWMPMDKWDACAGHIDLMQLKGRSCYAGLDLSSTSDLTTLVLVFPPSVEDGVYTVLPFFWLPEETLPLRVRRDHVMYDVWEKQKYLITTDGNVVHYGFIEQFICNLAEHYNMREIAYDRWNASMMVQTLQDDGFTMIPFGQGFKDMSPPTKELMRIVLEQKLNHGGHPILRWNMDNAYVRTDPAGNIKLDKEKSTEKIDGAVALVMALDRAMKNMNGGSIYDVRDMLTLDW